MVYESIANCSAFRHTNSMSCRISNKMEVAMVHSSEQANKLINEKSPYLLQHAYNPIDWYPWNKEAFAVAKRDNNPIFINIGYSCCR